MESSYISFVKNSLDSFKECYKFLAFKQTRIKTAVFFVNFILLYSKHQSTKERSFYIMKSILNHKEESEKNETLKKIERAIKTTASDGILTNNNEAINFIEEYFKKKSITHNQLKIRNLIGLNLHLLKTVNTYRKNAWYIFLSLIALGIFLGYFIHNIFVLSFFLIVPIITYYQNKTPFLLYELIQSMKSQEASLQESLFYNLIRKYDPVWKNKIDCEELINSRNERDTQRQNSKIAEKNLIAQKIAEKKIEIATIEDTDLDSMLEINEEDKGKFKVIKDFNNLGKDNLAILSKSFQHALDKRTDKIPYLLQNLWLSINHCKASKIVYNFLNLNNNNILSIIDKTNNKMNILHLLSTINVFKKNLAQKSTPSNQGVIKTLNDIEDIVLDNISLDNWVKLIEDSSTKISKKEIKIIDGNSVI